MRDHFDPLAVVYQNQPRELEQSPYQSSNSMQDRGQFSHQFHQDGCTGGRASPNNPFDAGFSQRTPSDSVTAAAAAAFNVAWHQPTNNAAIFGGGSHHGDSLGTKRSNNEFLDCNVLQSSLKRVRLSRCPGEFRLQRDLNTLDTKQWSATNTAAGPVNFSSTTWIHRSTGACLTMMDSLRICLFLPTAASGGGGGGGLPPQPHLQNQKPSYHRDYRWRIMIQIPRMYPHQPPVVTRIEGLSIDSIVISERPPDAHQRSNRGGSLSSPSPSSSLYYTETQLSRRSSSSETMHTSGTANTSSTISVAGTTGRIEWNQWSPISGLGELLDFLLGVAASNLSSGATAVAAASKNSPFAMSVAAGRRASSASSSSLSSVSSSSSSSCPTSSSSIWGKTSTSHNTSSIPSASSFFGGNGNGSSNHHNSAATIMMSVEAGTTGSQGTSVSGASFLLPNRFDVGYGRSGNGYERYNRNPHSFAGTAARGDNQASSASRGNDRANPMPYRETAHGEDDDAGMDMS